jgi:hypothetical protein
MLIVRHSIAFAQAEFNSVQKVAVGDLHGDSLADCMTKTAYLQLIVLAFIISTCCPISGSGSLLVLKK